MTPSSWIFFRVQHAQIPWRMIAGMRDKLIHEYDDVDLEEVWKTVATDLPPVIATLAPLATSEDE